tara:strand:+ start:4202 stop:5179 length:978 start_codon:yes stop_codon:yes gene_type:complete
MALKFNTDTLYTLAKKDSKPKLGTPIDNLEVPKLDYDTASPDYAQKQAISDMGSEGVDTNMLIDEVVNPSYQRAFSQDSDTKEYSDEDVARFQQMLTPTNIFEDSRMAKDPKDLFRPVEAVAEGTRAPLDPKGVIERSERFQALSPEAEFWGTIYQTTRDLDKMEKFDKDQGTYGSLDNEVGQKIQSAADVAGDVFSGDEGIAGTKLATMLKKTAAHESSGGKYDRQVGGGPAQGYWQVEPETARDLIANSSGYIGNKAKIALSEAMGSAVNLKSISDDDLVKLLRTPVGGAIFAGWKYLAGSKAASIRNKKQGIDVDPLDFLRA